MNTVIKTILEILGDEQETGGYILSTEDIDIPVFLNKDDTTQYPEIRVSPFISHDSSYINRWSNRKLTHYTEYTSSKFQIDLFDTDLARLNRSYRFLKDRMYEFLNLEIVIYNYNDYFIKPDGYNYYKNISYGIGDLFTDIYYIKLHHNIYLTRVNSVEDLVDDSFYVNKDALYIQTNHDLKSIQISVITQGRLLPNKDSLLNRGIIFIEREEARNLSDLEMNEVERISFDIYILFGAKHKRDSLPIVNKLNYRSKIK